jgi:hypothetical protein
MNLKLTNLLRLAGCMLTIAALFSYEYFPEKTWRLGKEISQIVTIYSDKEAGGNSSAE